MMAQQPGVEPFVVDLDSQRVAPCLLRSLSVGVQVGQCFCYPPTDVTEVMPNTLAWREMTAPLWRVRV